ncbi:MAG TPA: GNAT family N-acetyltransferase [Treponemataceae bacterium]|nr:GNAT family N-acetyltransferase [Treponemataceae bacterium]
MISCEPLTKKDLNQVVSFLSIQEQTCVALMSRLIDQGQSCMPPAKFPYWVLKDEKTEIHGVIMISSAGLVLHCFSRDFLNRSHTEPLSLIPLKKLLASFSLYCIMGAQEGTELLQNLYEKETRCKREYELLTYADSEYEKFRDKLSSLPIRRCSEKDADSLFHLQKEYDRVEVIPDGDTLNETASRQNLLRLLKSQEIFTVVQSSCFCAKAGTNAQGLNWVQIGGVYTDILWRNKGFAQLLVSYIAHSFYLRGKNVTLFVRTDNESAKRAYQKAGFSFNSYYTIVYYYC